MWSMVLNVSMGSRSVWSAAGLCLGPLLYIIYTSGTDLLFAEHGVLGQLYEDDTQAYVYTACHLKQAFIVVNGDH